MKRANRRMLLGCALSLAVALLHGSGACSRSMSGAGARTLYVDAESGDDDHDCATAQTACRTLQRAADLLRGGNELVVGPGTYFETPVFDELGSSKEFPVWIRAEPRGSAVVSGMWEAAARGKVGWREEGGGVYSTPSEARLFGSYGGVFLFRFLTVAELRAATAKSNAGPISTPDYGFAIEHGRLHLRLPKGENPNGKSLLFSPPSWDDEGEPKAVIRINDSPYVILDGLQVEGSGTFCVVFDQKSPFATVRNTLLHHCRYGLRLPDQSLVEWTEYSYPGLLGFAEEVGRRNGGKQHVFDLLKDYQPAWLEGGLADSYGHDGTSTGLEFRFNFMHEALDGESLGDFEYSSSHHNVYRSNYDDHVEMESWAGHRSRELRLHDSLFLSAGVISHQGESIEGPQHVYENVWYFLDDPGREMWTIIKSDAPASRAGIHYRNNLLWAARSELFWEERDRATLHFLDNILVFNRNLNHRIGGVAESDRNYLINDEDKPWLRGADGKYGGRASEAVVTHSGDRHVFSPGPGWVPGVGPFDGKNALGPDWPRPARTVFSDEIPERWKQRRDHAAVGSQ